MPKWVRIQFATLFIIALTFFAFFFISDFAYAMQLRISWKPNDPASEGYRIYLRTEGKTYDYKQPVWTGNSETAQLDHLEYEIIYYLVVRAFQGDLESANSEEVCFYLTDDNDADDDGILSINEIILYDTDPNNSDSDSDGIQDGTEIGLSIDDISSDTDSQFFIPDSDPTTATNPALADTDRDGLNDGEEDSNLNGKLDLGETDPNEKNAQENKVILVLREKEGLNDRLDVLEMPKNIGDDVATVLKDTNIGSLVEDIGVGNVDDETSSELYLFKKMDNGKNKLYVHNMPDGNPGDIGGPVLSDTDIDKRGDFLAVGDFDGDGKDEIAVIAPKKTEPDMFQLRCYEQPSGVKGDTGPAYASDLSMGKRIRGLAAGDWDDDGTDELVLLRANKVEVYAAPLTLVGSTGTPLASARIGGSVIDKGIAAGNFDDDTDMEIALVREKATGDDVRLMVYDAPYMVGEVIRDPIATDNNIGSGVKVISSCRH